jgi:Protein of unknown function (DUF3892)
MNQPVPSRKTKMGKKVVGAKADDKGNITAVLLKGNSTYTAVETAINMARKGQIDNAHVVEGESGPFLRTNPDDKIGNNLDEMAGDHK